MHIYHFVIVWQAIPDKSGLSFNALLQKCKSIVEIDKSVAEIDKLIVEKRNNVTKVFVCQESNRKPRKYKS